jgi:hypothetical protein
MIRELIYAFRARDRVSPSLDEMGRNARRAQGVFSRAFTAMGIDADGIARKLQAAFSFTGLATAAIQGITQIAGAVQGAFQEAIAYTSDVIEAQNVVNMVFGDGVAAVNEFAQNARAQFGLTERQVKQLSGQIGGMLANMDGLDSATVVNMSKGLTALAGDVASMFNMSAEEAFGKLMAGMRGSAEPLLTVGVNMSPVNLKAFAEKNGFKGDISKLDEASKAILRYNFLLDQTRRAQGDFGKEGASWAVSSQQAMISLSQAQAKLVEGFMPALIQAADVITTYMDRVASWAAENKAQIEEFANTTISKLLQIAEGIAAFVAANAGTFAQIAQSAITGLLELIAWAVKVTPVISNMINTLKKMGPVLLATAAVIKGRLLVSSIFMGMASLSRSFATTAFNMAAVRNISPAVSSALLRQSVAAERAAASYTAMGAASKAATGNIIGLAVVAVTAIATMVSASKRKKRELMMDEHNLTEEELKKLEKDAEKRYNQQFVIEYEEAAPIKPGQGPTVGSYAEQKSERKKREKGPAVSREVILNSVIAAYKADRKLAAQEEERQARIKEYNDKKEFENDMKSSLGGIYGMVDMNLKENTAETKKLGEQALNPAAMGLTDLWEIMRKGGSISLG